MRSFCNANNRVYGLIVGIYSNLTSSQVFGRSRVDNIF